MLEEKGNEIQMSIKFSGAKIPPEVLISYEKGLEDVVLRLITVELGESSDPIFSSAIVRSQELPASRNKDVPNCIKIEVETFEGDFTAPVAMQMKEVFQKILRKVVKNEVKLERVYTCTPYTDWNNTSIQLVIRHRGNVFVACAFAVDVSKVTVEEKAVNV